MISESLDYYRNIRNDFNREAEFGSMFSKELTICDELAIKYLKNQINPKMTILEIGCGMGNVIEALDCKEKYAIDLSSEMLKHCKIKNKLVASMDEIPFTDEKFDLVYMIMTLQQSFKPKKTIEEALRVLKKKGKLIIIDGDTNSSIGQLRQEQIKRGEWLTCGRAKWLDKKDFKGFEIARLADHILLLTKTK